MRRCLAVVAMAAGLVLACGAARAEDHEAGKKEAAAEHGEHGKEPEGFAEQPTRSGTDDRIADPSGSNHTEP